MLYTKVIETQIKLFIDPNDPYGNTCVWIRSKERKKRRHKNPQRQMEDGKLTTVKTFWPGLGKDGALSTL
jgi:hypothetical protein